MLNSLVQSLWYVFCCKFLGGNKEKSYEKLTADKDKTLKPVNLINIIEPQSVGNIGIVSNNLLWCQTKIFLYSIFL